VYTFQKKHGAKFRLQLCERDSVSGAVNSYACASARFSVARRMLGSRARRRGTSSTSRRSSLIMIFNVLRNSSLKSGRGVPSSTEPRSKTFVSTQSMFLESRFDAVANNRIDDDLSHLQRAYPEESVFKAAVDNCMI
jgi:hypothetical protein